MQPAHHRAPAQRRLCPLHRHQHQPALFHQGRADPEVWYFEHPLPADRKQYSKTRPIAIEEFDLEKAWWDDREENEYAWRVTADEIKARNYNLDIKNPHRAEAANGDPDELLERYHRLQQPTLARPACSALRDEVAVALERMPHVA